jgi:hypothetical protein
LRHRRTAFTSQLSGLIIGIAIAGCGPVRRPPTVYSEDPDTLVYQGVLGKEANERIFELYEKAAAKPRLLKVTSAGGDVNLGMDLGEWVFKNALDVEVVDHCLSSCANYVFTAGKARILNPDAVLLWHGGAYQSDLETQLKNAPGASAAAQGKAYLNEWRKREDAFFKKIGVNQSVTTYGQTALHVVRPPNTMGWDFSIEDMTKMGMGNIIEKGGPWSWRDLRPDYRPLVFRVEIK